MTVQPAEHPFLFDVGRQDLADTIAEAQAHLSPAVGVPKATGQTLHQAFRPIPENLALNTVPGRMASPTTARRRSTRSYPCGPTSPTLTWGLLDYRGCDEAVRNLPPPARQQTVRQADDPKKLLESDWGARRVLPLGCTSPDWSWRRPEDFDLIKRAPRELDADVERAAAPVPTWTVEQLAILYRYALPLERVFLFARSVNCADGADQAGRLSRPPPSSFGRRGGTTSGAANPPQQESCRLHLLWAQTNLAMNWALERRKSQQHDEDFLLLDRQWVYRTGVRPRAATDASLSRTCGGGCWTEWGRTTPSSPDCRSTAYGTRPVT